MKVQTIEQYKILEYIKENFFIDKLEIKLINRNTVEITDIKNEKMQLEFKNGEVFESKNQNK
jgi:hypothetical protein